MKSSLPILAGLGAIVLWASLALSSAKLAHLPSFLILSVAFLLGGLPVLFYGKKAFPSRWALAVGVAGYYGYHFLLFTALRLAPPVEANLINYLWPMLMVLLTPLFFRSAKLTVYHFAGAGLALAGCLLLLQGSTEGNYPSATWGYVCAVLAAFAWPIYSLTKKKIGDSSLPSIAGVCLTTGLLCLPTHWLTEPATSIALNDWPLLLWLGVGPFGLAFFLWDWSVHHGDPRVIGALSYLTPVLSTLAMVVFLGIHPPLSTWCALGLILGGAILGSRAGTRS